LLIHREGGGGFAPACRELPSRKIVIPAYSLADFQNRNFIKPYAKFTSVGVDANALACCATPYHAAPQGAGLSYEPRLVPPSWRFRWWFGGGYVMRLTLSCAVLVVMSGLGQAARAGQAATPVQLHGVVAHVDLASHSFGINGLSGLERYWLHSASNMIADGAVDVAALSAGQHVTVVLTKGTDGRYYARHVSVN